MARIAVLCVLGLALAFVATATAAAPGWRTYRVPSAGVTIDLPTSWQSADYAAVAGSLGAGNSSAAKIAQIAAQNKLVKFFAYAPATAPANVVVIRFSGSQLKDLGMLGELSSAAGQLGIDTKGLHLTQTTFPAGTAASIHTTTSAAGVKVEQSEYLFTHDGAVVAITFSASAEVFRAYAKTVTQALTSMRWLPTSATRA